MRRSNNFLTVISSFISGSIASVRTVNQKTAVMEDDKKLPRFNAELNEDFSLWALRFEVLCEAKEVYEVVFQDPFVDGEDVSTELKKSIAKARMLLVQCLGTKALRTVAGERKNPFVMYKKLVERYATKNTASRVQLQTQLHYMRYDSSMSMSTYIDSMDSIYNKLENQGSPIDQSMKVAILLASFGNVDETRMVRLFLHFRR